MTDILKKIAETKVHEIETLRKSISLETLEARARLINMPKGFANALKKPRLNKSVGLIAEIKKASPSKGIICSDFDPSSLAMAYFEGGADCLSVLTDKPNFQGSLDDLSLARKSVDLPILRKDFLIDPLQVVEARAFGADAILIIMAMIDDGLAKDLHDCAREWGMDVLVEIHNELELQRVMDIFEPHENLLLGINNRDLKTFTLSLERTSILSRLCPPDYFLVSESGIFTPHDVQFVADQGVKAVLVGESLMRQEDTTQAVKNLFLLA
jgi:indole-3-glycerol phosphate synthase